MAKVWCYVLDEVGVTGLTTHDGSDVSIPLLHHIYECEDDNVDLDEIGIAKLYHAPSDLIDPEDLAIAIGVHSDTVIPVITMIGTDVSQEVGLPYEDQGATAYDNVNGDITADIVATSTVDINTIGQYQVSYEVSDSAGNAAIGIARTVGIVAAATTTKTKATKSKAKTAKAEYDTKDTAPKG